MRLGDHRQHVEKHVESLMVGLANGDLPLGSALNEVIMVTRAVEKLTLLEITTELATIVMQSRENAALALLNCMEWLEHNGQLKWVEKNEQMPKQEVQGANPAT